MAFDENGIAYDVYQYNEQGTIAIKSELLEGRAVQIGYLADATRPGQDSDPKCLNTDTWAHYTYESQLSNHAITIVGWDDDYSRENFLEGHQPPYDGAWIVKNSWGSGSQEFPNAGNWGVDEDGDGVGDGYFYLSYYEQSLSKPETLDFDVSGSEGRSSHIVNAYDYMPSQELNMVSSADPLQTANVFTAECDQLVTTVTTETSTPYTSVRYEVYLLDDNATNPTDGTLVGSASDTYQYGGFHQTDLQHGVVVREGQKFSVAVTQRTVTGQYQMQAECTIDKEGAEAIKEISGINMPTYTTGVVNEGEITGDFPDKADVSDWAAPSMAWAVDSGIVHGNNGMLEPQRAITRAELATMLPNAHDAGL